MIIAEVAFIDMTKDPDSDERVVKMSISGSESEEELIEVINNMKPRYRWLYYNTRHEEE